MPSLPTSLLFVALAVAWLWVLVPMFAKSRQAVPEIEDSAGFRVLRRISRKHRARYDEIDAEYNEQLDDEFDDELNHHEGNELVEDLVDADLDDESEFDDDLYDERVEYDNDEMAADTRPALEPMRRAPEPQVAVAGRQYSYVEDVAADDHELDAADEWQSEHELVSAAARSSSSRGPSTAQADRTPMHRPADPILERTASQRPVRRSGRGGYDPEVDARQAADRFRRRRMVSLTLLIATLGLIAGGYLISGTLYAGAAVTAVLLVLYLAYLRKQVKIERSVSERRRARMDRAREIRPTMARPAAPSSPYRAERPAELPASVPARRPERFDQRPVAQSGSHGYAAMELDDDDPAFDDLERHEPVVFRRAAGQ